MNTRKLLDNLEQVMDWLTDLDEMDWNSHIELSDEETAVKYVIEKSISQLCKVYGTIAKEYKVGNI